MVQILFIIGSDLAQFPSNALGLKKLVTTITGHDPNDLLGPAGFGPNGFIVADQVSLPYRIDFENDPA